MRCQSDKAICEYVVHSKHFLAFELSVIEWDALNQTEYLMYHTIQSNPNVHTDISI